MNWIKISDRNNARFYLPKNKPFIGLWKGSICLCEFDEELDHFYLGMMPGSYLGFWKLDKEREAKFTHYCLVEIPDDY